MPRSIMLLVTAGFVCMAGPALAAQDCVAALTGEWATKGQVDMGIAKVKVDNRDTYNADATFRSSRRFLNQSGTWEEQVTSGNWTAKPGKRANDCVLELSSKSEFGSSSSSSTLTIVGKNAFRSFGVDAKRVR